SRPRGVRCITAWATSRTGCVRSSSRAGTSRRASSSITSSAAASTCTSTSSGSERRRSCGKTGSRSASSRRFQEAGVAEKNELRAELLLGRKVRSLDGTVLGRIEQLRAEREHDYWVVSEFHVGPTALIERLAVRHLG